MRSLLRSILFVRPSATICSATSPLPLIRQLHLNSRLTRLRCQFPQQQHRRQELQLGRIRWASSGPENTGSSGSGSGNRPSPALPSMPTGPDFKNLPSQKEFRRSEMTKKVTKAMEDLQIAAFSAGQKLNVLTGYSEIEALKKEIEQLEATVKSSRAAVRTAKEDYQSAIARRSASQREVNELLQRKHAWSTSDLERFTSLYRSDHANEQAESAAQEQLAIAERVADEVQAKLSRSILSRYHEEQIWSDKIRRASTWVTWGLMGFNVFLFVVVQLWLEPWKRKRLVGGFEEKVREVIQGEALRNASLNLHVEPESVALDAGIAAKQVEDPPDETASVNDEPVFPEEDIVYADEDKAPIEGLSPLEADMIAVENQDKNILGRALWEVVRWAEFASSQVGEAFSEQPILIKKVDFATALLECMALGAFVTALISLVLNSP